MKKPAFKKVYLFFSSLFIFILHMPFVFAKAKTVIGFLDKNPTNHPVAAIDSPLVNTVNGPLVKIDLYDSLCLGSLGLAREAFDYAMKGFIVMKSSGELTNGNIISIIDFSKPSSEKRLFVLDVVHYKLLFNTYVAHGMQSGKEFAKRFSNKPKSNKSSLGFYETLGTYFGGNGYSLKLQGIEKGINDNANKRAIVIHGADYVNESFIHSQGYIGRSWGCPALPERQHKAIIDVIKNGTCLFIFSPDNSYLSHSRILNHGAGPMLAFK
ncbi:murein L,D-transpeptidase catalytic domain family protein [Ferruginibacter sp.]|uniref:murein L,D-transpeptidase catalytic domain family protein n=1 Tax=Ferruginibacter sp. TaxID=1940288 RepID=UPI00374CCA67